MNRRNTNRSAFVEPVFETFDSVSGALSSAIAAVWNEACGPALAISERFVSYNIRTPPGAVHAGQVAQRGGEMVGFVLASRLPHDPQTASPSLAWIDAIAVHSKAQNQGIGSRLEAWAADWARAQHCTKQRLGGSLRPFTPGFPSELGDARFFSRRGYQPRPANSSVWDVAADLLNYSSRFPAIPGTTVRPMQPEEARALEEFLQREFPNRWLYEFKEFRRERGRPSDYMLLFTERGVDGFARLTFEDSERPIDRFHMQGLARPWGQLGPIGVSRGARGQGYASLLLDRSLLRLREQGVRGCVIDWTGLLEFYEKFGFKPFREYVVLEKVL